MQPRRKEIIEGLRKLPGQSHSSLETETILVHRVYMHTRLTAIMSLRDFQQLAYYRELI